MSDFLPENTPRGLPGPLPPTERILWQGAPTTSGIAVRAFHAQLVAGWFALMALALGAGTTMNGSFVKAIAVVSPTLLAGTAGIGLLMLLGWLVHRTTVYTITSQRIVLHAGIALPVTLNLPFAQIDTAGFHGFSDGTGDIPIQLRDGQKVAYLNLWPHARPWRVARPEPMMRSVPEAAKVANILARALTAQAGREEEAAAIVVTRPRASEPVGQLAAAGAR